MTAANPATAAEHADAADAPKSAWLDRFARDPLAALAEFNDDFIRLPGLYRRWDLSQVITPDADFHIEYGGETSDGTTLYSIYKRDLEPVPPLAAEPTAAEPSHSSVPAPARTAAPQPAPRVRGGGR